MGGYARNVYIIDAGESMKKLLVLTIRYKKKESQEIRIVEII